MFAECGKEGMPIDWGLLEHSVCNLNGFWFLQERYREISEWDWGGYGSPFDKDPAPWVEALEKSCRFLQGTKMPTWLLQVTRFQHSVLKA